MFIEYKNSRTYLNYIGVVSVLINSCFCFGFTKVPVRPGLILSGQNSFCQARTHSVRPELILSGQNSFCQARTHAVRPELILSGQNSFFQARPYFVRPEIILSGQTIFCQVRPHFCEIRPYSLSRPHSSTLVVGRIFQRSSEIFQMLASQFRLSLKALLARFMLASLKGVW